MRKRIITGDSVVDTIIFAEEVANIIMAEQNQSKNNPVKVAKCRTIKEKFGPYRTISDTELLDVSGQGSLVELTIISDNPNFSLYINVDSYSMFSDTFEQLQNLSQYTTTVDAFVTDSGEYITRISNLDFTESLNVKISPLEEITVRGLLIYKKC